MYFSNSFYRVNPVIVKIPWISQNLALVFDHQVNQQMTLKKVAIRCVTQKHQSLSVILKGVLPEEYTFVYCVLSFSVFLFFIHCFHVFASKYL